ncbi:hypothetical protein HU200_056087 [Digitaria exilis]|uniref:Uncharacterized protein n=1 Tax=Digitaria exilis TaxID=1010633 RepID=A0A835AJK0_9POAL|nr:hypothetical protein HU200_056087 [Digitaria exilis]
MLSSAVSVATASSTRSVPAEV